MCRKTIFVILLVCCSYSTELFSQGIEKHAGDTCQITVLDENVAKIKDTLWYLQVPDETIRLYRFTKRQSGKPMEDKPGVAMYRKLKNCDLWSLKQHEYTPHSRDWKQLELGMCAFYINEVYTNNSVLSLEFHPPGFHVLSSASGNNYITFQIDNTDMGLFESWMYPNMGVNIVVPDISSKAKPWDCRSKAGNLVSISPMAIVWIKKNESDTFFLLSNSGCALEFSAISYKQGRHDPHLSDKWITPLGAINDYFQKRVDLYKAEKYEGGDRVWREILDEMNRFRCLGAGNMVDASVPVLCLVKEKKRPEENLVVYDMKINEKKEISKEILWTGTYAQKGTMPIVLSNLSSNSRELHWCYPEKTKEGETMVFSRYDRKNDIRVKRYLLPSINRLIGGVVSKQGQYRLYGLRKKDGKSQLVEITWKPES